MIPRKHFRPFLMRTSSIRAVIAVVDNPLKRIHAYLKSKAAMEGLKNKTLSSRDVMNMKRGVPVSMGPSGEVPL